MKRNDLEDLLLSVYMLGFDDELKSNSNLTLISKAYLLGKGDAIVDDDTSNVDLQTNEDILKRILIQN